MRTSNLSPAARLVQQQRRFDVLRHHPFSFGKRSVLFVYPGLALMKRVDSDPNQFAYKIQVGRSVNAKTPLKELNRYINHDPRIMKRWLSIKLQ